MAAANHAQAALIDIGKLVLKHYHAAADFAVAVV